MSPQLQRAVNAARWGMYRKRCTEYERPHLDSGHGGEWYACHDVPCRRAWALWVEQPQPSDDEVARFVAESSDNDLLNMRNLGSGSLARLRVWSGAPAHCSTCTCFGVVHE